ncbi:hypothetical protein BO78DRAFT_45185 [Aspergillus sclerotiicarbonarius CBS 121057]|uniref:Secreted protein n=1 Tax=Aspergillus sclerotiicarbonarius (strain CBS 121057 / IBT 28362) TaxID=1448318 RepID=A0A319E9I3_ASPSB|nr:hypothetical protein BO78DRAFT_45185 [Aspergillus sclerotiicarbonarius CBS 121057]
MCSGNGFMSCFVVLSSRHLLVFCCGPLYPISIHTSGFNALGGCGSAGMIFWRASCYWMDGSWRRDHGISP